MKIKIAAIKHLIYLLVFIFLLIALNYVASFRFFRVDLTKDKLHSLTEKTIDLLEQIDDVISIEVYLDGDNFPAEVQKLKNGLKEKLDEFKAYGGMNIEYRFIDPNEDKEMAADFKKQIYEAGLDPSYVQVMNDSKSELLEIWPGLILRQGELFSHIQLLQGGKFPISQRIINHFNDQLEYKLIKGLLKLTENNKKTISFLRGHGELNNAEAWTLREDLLEFYDVDTVSISQLKNDLKNNAIDYGEQKYDSIISMSTIRYFLTEKDTIDLYDEAGNLNKGAGKYIKRYFEIKKLKEYKRSPSNLSENLRSLDKSHGLIIAKPTHPFSDKDKYIIDQYIMNGGKVFWLIDMMEVNENLLKDSSFVFSDPVNINLDNMLYKYGARINKNLITDSYCGPIKRKDGLGDIFTWFFHPLLTMNEPNEFTRNVNPVRLRYASSVDPVGDPRVRKTVILETSERFKVFRQTTVNYMNLYNYNPENFDLPPGVNPLTMGLILEGKFNSHFKGRALNDKFKSFLNNPKVNFKDESSENMMVVIGDGDFIRNDFINMNGQLVPVSLSFEAAKYGTSDFLPVYGNDVFFLNLVDKLMGNDILIPLRSRMKSPRLLNNDEIKNNRKYWQFINLIIPVIIIVVIGLLVWIYRKKKFTSY